MNNFTSRDGASHERDARTHAITHERVEIAKQDCKQRIATRDRHTGAPRGIRCSTIAFARDARTHAPALCLPPAVGCRGVVDASGCAPPKQDCKHRSRDRQTGLQTQDRHTGSPHWSAARHSLIDNHVRARREGSGQTAADHIRARDRAAATWAHHGPRLWAQRRGE